MKAPPQVSLKRRSLWAGAWAGGSHALSQVIRLAGNLVLARFLLPEAFGVMAVISTLMMALNLLSDIGSGTVIVQSPRGADKAFLNTAWTLQIIRGFVIWFAGLLLAIGLAWGQTRQWFAAGTVYGDPRLPLMIGVATISMAINGFSSINAKLAERNLELKTIALIDVGSQVAALLVMVVGAILTSSVWALIVGGLFSSALKCALSHVFLKGPSSRLRLEGEAMRELLGKGKWVLVSSLLGFLAMNGDRFVLGGLTDGTTLGLYSIALGLASIGPAALFAIMGKVMYPAFSEVVRSRIADLERTYSRFQHATDLCVGMLAGIMFMASDAVIGLLYDQRYQGAGPMFGILAIGSIGARFHVVEIIYMAMGRNSLLAAAILPRVVILLVGLPLGYSAHGINGALAAVVCSQFAHWPTAIWFRVKHGLNTLRNDALLPPALAAGAGVGWLLAQALTALRGWGAAAS